MFSFLSFCIEPPVSLIEENIISHLLTGIKIHYHIYIIANMPPIDILVLAVCGMFVTWTWFNGLSSHESPVAQWQSIWTSNQKVIGSTPVGLEFCDKHSHSIALTDDYFHKRYVL